MYRGRFLAVVLGEGLVWTRAFRDAGADRGTRVLIPLVNGPSHSRGFSLRVGRGGTRRGHGPGTAEGREGEPRGA